MRRRGIVFVNSIDLRCSSNLLVVFSKLNNQIIGDDFHPVDRSTTRFQIQYNAVNLLSKRSISAENNHWSVGRVLTWKLGSMSFVHMTHLCTRIERYLGEEDRLFHRWSFPSQCCSRVFSRPNPWRSLSTEPKAESWSVLYYEKSSIYLNLFNDPSNDIVASCSKLSAMN